MNLWNEISVLDSANKNVKKYVYKNDKAIAESVLYKYPSYEERTVMCISTQSGCAMGCTFCGASAGLINNLSSALIVDQVDYMLKSVDCSPEQIKNWQIMFMSMGEPMHNFKNLEDAIRKFNALYPNAKLLISTSAPKSHYWQALIDLSVEIDEIGLQFSVHESTDKARDILIPIKNKLGLSEIAEMGNAWHSATGRNPFFNYCVHEKNNSQDDIDRLVNLFTPGAWESTISVICEKDETVSQSIERQADLAAEFSQKMLNAGYSTRVFNPAGQDDIGGGCGQLWQVQKWIKENG